MALKDGEPFKHKLQVDTGERLWNGCTTGSDVAELLMVALWAEKAKNKTFAVINESEEEQSGLEQYYDLLPG